MIAPTSVAASRCAGHKAACGGVRRFPHLSRAASAAATAATLFPPSHCAPHRHLSWIPTASLHSSAPSCLPFRLFSLSRSQTQQQQKQQQELASGESEIISLLTKRFQPSHLQVQDVSGGCGSFYAIVVAAKDFQGLSTVKQHRLVNECLKDIIGGIHGLQVGHLL